MTAFAIQRRRGQPLIALAVLLMGWVGLRAVLWDLDIVVPRTSSPQPSRASPHVRAPTGLARVDAAAMAEGKGDSFLRRAASISRLDTAPRTTKPAQVRPVTASEPELRMIAPHELLLMAGPDYLTLPEAASLAPVPKSAQQCPARQKAASNPVGHAALRWSGDGWLLWRAGGGGAALSAGTPAYGGSQAGTVVRYWLGGRFSGAPYLYARASGALDMPGDRPEAAFGIGSRPVDAVPVRLLSEVRVRGTGAGVRVRPAIAAITELPPVRLPGGVSGEVYGQAGYAGGRDATAFFDLQALAKMQVARPARHTELSLGGGVWAGGQRGAARLDLGPRVAVQVDLGAMRPNVALDWRLRVAGNAAPTTGAALTLSTGF